MISLIVKIIVRLLNLSANASDEEVNKVFDIKSYNIPGMQSQTSNTAPTSATKGFCTPLI